MRSSKIDLVWSYFKDIEDFTDLEVFDHILSIMIEEFQRSPKIHLNNIRPEIRFNDKTFAEINVNDNIYHIKFLDLMNHYNTILSKIPNEANIVFYSKNDEEGRKVPVEIKCEDLGGKIMNGQIIILLNKNNKNKKNKPIFKNKKLEKQPVKNIENNSISDDENKKEVEIELGNQIENDIQMEEDIENHMEMVDNVLIDNNKQFIFELLKNEDKSKLSIEKLEEYLLLINNEIELNNVNRTSLIHQINEMQFAFQQKFMFLDSQVKHISCNTIYLSDQKSQIEILINIKNENEKLKKENEKLKKLKSCDDE